PAPACAGDPPRVREPVEDRLSDQRPRQRRAPDQGSFGAGSGGRGDARAAVRLAEGAARQAGQALMRRWVLLLCLFAALPAYAAEDLAERVIARLASYPVVRAGFVQDRTQTSFTNPVVIHVHMVHSRELCLIWQV